MPDALTDAKKYRKKPVVIEAYQTKKELVILTLEGAMIANPGDWIITGVNGEQYPCKPDIFAKTYEPADNGSTSDALTDRARMVAAKDSVVILELCRMAKVKFEAHHSLTTIDPPELVRFVKATPDVIIDRPKKSFFQLLVTHGFPLRHKRWCCSELKENAGKGRLVITGVRWAESARRSKRKMFDVCYRGKGSRLLHPIIDWSEKDVWEFIRSRGLPYCCLYDEGRKRLGCLFCPMQPVRQRLADMERYPKYANAFRRAFQRRFEDRMIHNPDAVNRHRDGYAMFDWWINERKFKSDDGGLFT